MKTDHPTYQVAIVGGGPVGLYLGCCLQKAGISCIVLDEHSGPVTHSRSIGIHPVSLELFDELGIADIFIREGTQVEKGQAFINSQHIGNISFENCPPPYTFILTLPQFKTEQLLENHLQTLDSSILHRNMRVTDLQQTKDAVHLTFQKSGQNSQKITANYVVGCDGIHSFIRTSGGINFKGKAYDDTYIMGDFSDNTELGSDAAVFLCREGLIESFPLSPVMRRWVVKTDHYFDKVNRTNIEEKVAARINHHLGGTKNTMLSSFGVQKKLAGSMAKGRILLAGDAAHVLSPIGGQGMNLGWLDAHELARCLTHALANASSAQKIFRDYSKRRLKVARKAIRRAEFNMALGRKTGRLRLRKILLQTILKTPLSHLAARLFTMRGLENYPF